jgi:hypothetical protein
MLEIIAHIPSPPIHIGFLNRADQLDLFHNQESPAAFLQTATNRINQVFARGPAGTTPYYERMRAYLSTASPDRKTAWYFFGDGVPDGGLQNIHLISQLVKNRPNPSSNPTTFISCTDNDKDVEWMKDLEEVAPYCSECDDYNDEKEEVLKDQGYGFPYTKGFYLIACLVGAMNPADLVSSIFNLLGRYG